MTPEEKSKELIARFRKAGIAAENEVEIHSATQCAIIAVEEIIKVAFDGIGYSTAKEYWTEVLNHLKNKS